MTDAVIQIEHLTKTYSAGFRRTPVYAVKDLNLTVKQGSVVAFVGPNGAGKTTTIYSLLGFLKPDKGTLQLFGQPVGSAALRRRVGYQCEIFHTYPFYTATQALNYYGRLSGMSKESLALAIPVQLNRMGIAEAADRKAKGFSKGMTQRLGLAQALLHEPELLILDEPTSGLDPEGRRLVLDIIREEKARGRTVFLSSHILSDVERICDEVFMIRQGEIVFSDRLATVGTESTEWQIEVLGITPSIQSSIQDVIGNKARLQNVNGETAILVCQSEHKQELLKALVLVPLEIGTVQRHRGGSLEETYMKYVGRA